MAFRIKPHPVETVVSAYERPLIFPTFVLSVVPTPIENIMAVTVPPVFRSM